MLTFSGEVNVGGTGSLVLIDSDGSGLGEVVDARGVASRGDGGLGVSGVAFEVASWWRLHRWNTFVAGSREAMLLLLLVVDGIWTKGVFRTLKAVRSAVRENILLDCRIGFLLILSQISRGWALCWEELMEVKKS